MDASSVVRGRDTGIDGQRMYAAVYLRFQSFVDHSMNGHSGLAAKRFRTYAHAKVAFAFRSVSGMPLVEMRLVHHIKRSWLKSFG